MLHQQQHHEHHPITIQYGDDDFDDENHGDNHNSKQHQQHGEERQQQQQHQSQNNAAIIHWLRNSHSLHTTPSSSSMIQWTKLTNFSAIQSKYRSLLIRVYLTLTLTVVSAVLGFCFYTASSARISLPPLLTLLIMFSLIFYLKITGVTAESDDHDDRDEHERQQQESANDDSDIDNDPEQFIIAENENSRSNYSNSDHNSWMEHYFSRRNWILYLFGFINGLHLSPLISHIVAMSDNNAVDVGSAAFGDSSSSLSLFVIKYGTPLLALLATCLIFASFSAFSLLTKRRSMLYLGGFLSSALSILVLFSMFSLLFGFGASGAGGGGQWLSQMVMLYGGLMLFVGFVIFDTQIMIEKLHAGYRDTVNLSLELFIDFVGIFVRILIILAKKNNRRK